MGIKKLESKLKRINSIVEPILSNPCRKYVKNLYRASFKAMGYEPFLKTAKDILKKATSNSKVLITTGFPIAKKSDTDGPLGAAVLAKELSKIGFKIVFLTEKLHAEIINNVCCSLGFKNFNMIITSNKNYNSTVKSVVDGNFKILIAIEKPSWNSMKVYHNMYGENISSLCAPIDIIFDLAYKSNTLTIGVGDGGNEIGMGTIRKSVLRYVPYGKICICECKSGIASITPTKNLLVGGTSNWASYFLAALIAMLSGNLFDHNEENEKLIFEAAIKSGAVDGFSGKAKKFVDGIPLKKDIEIVNKICSLNSLKFD
jgi:hypothetical protein